MVVIGPGEVEIELEWIVLTEIWRVAAVLETVKEEAKARASDKFRSNLIGESEPRRKIRLL